MYQQKDDGRCNTADVAANARTAKEAVYYAPLRRWQRRLHPANMCIDEEMRRCNADGRASK